MFKKGHKKTGGATIGSKHEKTKQWQVLSEYLLNEGVNRFLKVLKKADDRDFIKIYLTMLEYFKPKQNRINDPALDAEDKLENIKVIVVNKYVPSEVQASK